MAVYSIGPGIAYFRAELSPREGSSPWRGYTEAGIITRRRPAMCGPTSLALVLRSAGIAARTDDKVLARTSMPTVFGACAWAACARPIGEEA